MIYIKTHLPEILIDRLKKCEHIVFRNCISNEDIPILELNNSDTGITMFLDYLKNDNIIYEKNGPILRPHFGNPIYPSINPLTQVELLNLLYTYQQNNTEFIIPSSYTYNIQYNSNSYIYLLFVNIKNKIHKECPLLNNLEPDTIICYFTITYSNIIVIITLKSI
jgi:hypothetical protein